MDKDERFKHIATDPKFRRIPKSERKVKIDKRFQSMFTDEKFKLKYTTDKRGRPVNHTSTEDLKRYYELTSEDESDESSEENETGKLVKLCKKESKDLNKKQSGDKTISDDIKKKLKDLSVDYARGEALVATDSSSDDDELDEELSDSDGVDHGWGEFDKDADRTEEATKRLAVCNQDWDRIRALDLMVLFNSFVPSGGLIHSVTIYPSDFGLQRLKEEEIKGPIELTKQDDEFENEETEEGSKYHMEKLRQYQLNRLKYYYAVVTCDSAETANKIYTECDGMEYESTATKIDLRFIPDDMDFENEPKEICEKLPEKYEPRFFTTTALQQAKVELTWDETNPERLEITKKLASGKVDDVSEADLQAYLASSSEESEAEETNNDANDDETLEDNKNTIDKYRSLLQDIESSEKKKDDKGVEMEISWGLNVKEKTEKLVKKKLAEKEEKTPFQQYLDKRKEKKKAKKEERKKKSKENEDSDSEDDSDIPSDIDMNDPYFAEEFNKPEFKKKKSRTKTSKDEHSEEAEKNKAELELLLLNENEDSKKHFNLKKIQDQENKTKKSKKKRKKAIEDVLVDNEDFQVDVKDDRFSALYSSHHFNIDPTDSKYKKTKGMEALIEEKLKRRNNEEVEDTPLKKPKKDAQLNVLVKSIKRKTQALGTRK